jgi:hypothetical protein
VEGIQVAITLEMAFEGPDAERRFIFLYRKGRGSRDAGRMPGRSRRKSRMIFVEKEALTGEKGWKKAVETSGQVPVSRPVKGMGDDGSITRPEVGIGIPGKGEGIGIDGSHNGSVGGHMVPEDEKTVAEKVPVRLGKTVRGGGRGVDPEIEKASAS